MTVQTVKLGKERFVLIREKDFRDLKAKAAQAPRSRKVKQATAQDRGDIAEAQRRRRETTKPYSQLRKDLGLA
jgi:hypothetical protein